MRLALIAAVLALPALAAADEPPERPAFTTAGTLELGGGASFNYYSTATDLGERTYEANGATMSFHPAVGWFVLDRFLLRTVLMVQHVESDVGGGTYFGGSLEPLYLFPLGASYLYVGATAGYHEATGAGMVTFGGLGGLLVPLNG